MPHARPAESMLSVMGDLTTSLRALAHPGSVLALVLLVLNDHVLKQAWPGWVTGKLSDVAGLVVAPLLLSAVLTAVRVTRPLHVAVVATGAGFAFCKTTTFGATVTSDVWSLFGTPTMIRADVTDLLALPGLYAAWRIHRACVTTTRTGWRRTVAVAVGTALLPVGVLATSATSCSEYDGVTGVAVLEGDFGGPPEKRETRLGVNDGGGRLTIDADGRFTQSSFEIAGDAGHRSRAETCAGRQCWRLVGRDAVETSTDGGRTWRQEAALTDADREEIAEVVGDDDECGDAPEVGAVDIAVMEGDGYVQVVVALLRGGIWVRHVDGSWSVVTTDEMRERVRVDEPPLPVVTEVDGPEDPTQELGPDPSVDPSPSCASPTPRTVTPHPLNGPPTTYEVCP